MQKIWEKGRYNNLSIIEYYSYDAAEQEFYLSDGDDTGNRIKQNSGTGIKQEKCKNQIKSQQKWMHVAGQSG